MTFKLVECFIKETVLLEYLNLTLGACSWVSLCNSLAFTQILLYYCKEFLWWLFQLQADFQLATLNSCGITGWSFYSQIRLCNFDTSWVLCNFDTSWVLYHISVVFSRFFSNHKRHSYDGYSAYMLSFIQFLPVVYPVGLTDLWPSFMQKIDHNSVNLNEIPWYGDAL